MTVPGVGRRPDLVAVVTGASRGLGAGLAAAFAAEGIRLGLCARTRPRPPPAASDVVREALDVTDAAALDAFALAVAGRFGRIDLWINNAGVLEPIGPLVQSDPVALRHNITVNVLGVLHGSATFARHVRSRPGRGVLINVVSGAATHPYEGWAAYCAAKAAVAMATEVVAREERDRGLVTFALTPGVVDTDMQALVRKTAPDEFPEGDRFRRLYAEGRLRAPSEVARFILERLVDVRTPGGEDQPVQVRIPDEWPGGG
jgi:benzil reductase ((S)-benzoin forming)